MAFPRGASPLVAGVLAVTGCTGEQATVTPTASDSGFETQFETCAEVRAEVNVVPVHLLLAVDRSGSMGNGEPVSKWESARDAFSAFLQDPDAQALSVALRLWPAEDGCNEDDCDAAACAEPQIALASLADDAHRKALIAELANVTPEGGTPMSAALEGAVAWAEAQQVTTPNAAASIVLVTDGAPSGCDENIDNIAAFAATGLEQGIRTFAVGIEGSNEDDINALAEAGGTEQGRFVGAKDLERGLLAALQDIRGDVLSCSFALPEGETINPDRVRLEVVQGDTITVIERRSSLEACDDINGGWAFDDAGLIVLCPTSCAEVQDIDQGAVEIAIGCECETDTDCPDAEVCDDNVCVPCEALDACALEPSEGRGRVVQGGALRCQTGPASAWGWAALLGLVRLRRRDA